MILLIDNYDSFTYNLYQYLGELGEEVKVVRNDELTVEDIQKLNPASIVLSPGPGRPENAGIMIEVIQKLHQQFPILGICLGHQGIGSAFGAKVVRAENIMHGKTSYLADVNNDPLFAGLISPIEVMRYHSLVIQKDTLPRNFEVLAVSHDDQEIMAIKHKHYPVYGFQFHPESVGTDTGKQLLANFITETRKGVLR
ncbi:MULTISPECIES: aminodeoxychorismate/anthranilate synthase component II [unclassified Niallia]|uniref:anthranilate synthase component II n=1 Tax=Niallia TaxID=2837506 RepID=UPI001EDB18BB|nr:MULTISPECIES: aminodeoxychorismate/anthranilate synthase component II [unclassified Niallia]MCM3030802.1 aminodeoxychorismate/anthranilate synthase component II [Niallia sp. MER 6]MDL0436135.1 aminodeoxychorismate/anthranilate synthase component II [Niallia sp. SS-2023]UPO86127.1 aminodeoxychorismate/anthranilate synthase component II [Niallia sp. Man26]